MQILTDAKAKICPVAEDCMLQYILLHSLRSQPNTKHLACLRQSVSIYRKVVRVVLQIFAFSCFHLLSWIQGSYKDATCR